MKTSEATTPRSGGNRRRRHKRRQWLLRQRKKQLRRDMRMRRRAGSGPRPLSGLHLNTHTKGSVSADKEQKITIQLPAVLDFDENYEQTASHFAVLREAIHNRKRIRNLDFSSIESISPSAALVLASEVDQWNQQVGMRLRANLPSWKDDIKRLLCQMGYFELLQLEKPVEACPRKKQHSSHSNAVRRTPRTAANLRSSFV
jgi:anti-anti-sigma regulatory factor